MKRFHKAMSMLRYSFIAMLSAFVLCGQSTAAPSPSPSVVEKPQAPETASYTLSELVTLALRHTPLLESLGARAEEKRLSARQAGSWPSPSVDVEAGRKGEGGPSGRRYGASVSQPLPLLGKPGLRGERLSLDVESWQTRQSASERSVALTVVQLAYEYAVNRRKAEYAQERQKRFQLIESYMAGRVFASPQRRTESRIVRNRLKILSAEALQSHAAFKATLEKMRVYLPLGPGSYPVIEVPWLSGNRGLDQKEWLAKALDRNPDLRIQQLEMKGAQVDRTIAAREGWPDPSFIASYEQARTVDTEKNVGMGIGLALPPWNLNRSAVRSAEKKITAEERLLAFQRQEVSAEISRTLAEYEASRQVVLNYPENQMAEQETQLREAEEGFRRGQVDLLTFLEFDSSAAEAFSSTVVFQGNLVSQIADIWRLSGEENLPAQITSF